MLNCTIHIDFVSYFQIHSIVLSYTDTLITLHYITYIWTCIWKPQKSLGFSRPRQGRCVGLFFVTVTASRRRGRDSAGDFLVRRVDTRNGNGMVNVLNGY